MVHTGRPSRGCGVCRKRRIKCDERSPECSYCIKTKQKCPGYKDQFDLAWRDQTTIAQKSVEKRKQASDKRAAVDQASCNDLTRLSRPRKSLIAEETVQYIPPYLQENAETEALGFFFSTYTHPSISREERRDFLEYVGPQFVKAKPDSTLRAATTAVATLVCATWLDRQPFNPLSHAYYLQALSTMKERICEPKGCVNNDILTSVLLLQMYESIIGTINRSKLSNTHLHGALALIKHRGPENFKDEIGQGLLAAVRGQLIDEAFRRKEPVGEEASKWTDHLKGKTVPPSTQLDNINIDLSNLEASIFRLAAVPSSPRYQEDILQRAQDIERRFLAWSDSLPPSWHPLKVTGDQCIAPTTKIAGIYQDYCYVYPSISVSTTWNKSCISRIKTQVIIRDQLLQQPLTQSNLTSRKQCQKMIQQMADDICASVPFYLGDNTTLCMVGDKRVQYPHAPGRAVPDHHYQMAPALGGCRLMGHLKALLDLRIELREGQKDWVCGQIERIEHIYNFWD